MVFSLILKLWRLVGLGLLVLITHLHVLHVLHIHVAHILVVRLGAAVEPLNSSELAATDHL